MSDIKVIFRGDKVEGLALQSIKARLMKGLNLSEDKVDKLLSSSEVVLKRVSTSEQAAKFQAFFRKLGLITEISGGASPELAVVPKELVKEEPRSPVVEPTVSPVEEADDDLDRSELRDFIRPALIAVIALSFLIMYSPASDGMLRAGFIIGLIVAAFSVISFKRVYE